MNPVLTDDMRARIAGFLPGAITQALTSYARFLDTEMPDDAKGFTAHHQACKVAIAHIELLLKMARWANVPSGDSAQDAGLAAILAQAEAEIERFNAASDTDGDGGE